MDVSDVLSDATIIFSDIQKGYHLRSHLSKISNELKLYEKVSVVFLLCETPRLGLGIMDKIINEPSVSAQNNIFHNWFKQNWIFKHKDWKDKLAELFTILQNYRLAKMLHYTKKDLIEKFMPMNGMKTYWIPAVRKILYILCEGLDSEEFNSLSAMIEGVDSVTNKYSEYKLLQWSERGLINLGNDKAIDLSFLIKCLKSLNLNNFVHNIEVVIEKTNCELVRYKSVLKLDPELAEYYEIVDKKNLGLCVIINEKNFSNSLFPKRWGSDKDVERLIEVFTAFGFDTKVHVDLTHNKFINTLAYYSSIVDESSSFFVLIILSHGSENVIYTSDSMPVDMNTIEMIFQADVCPSLIGKPKIFIVQSCQGEKFQRVVQDTHPDIESDSCILSDFKQPERVGPQRGDSMIAWSTVQGFASFRDKYNGSWYIQELCNELWKFGDTFDLVEIFTKVNNNLRMKIIEGQFMVPSLLLSLRAKIQFTNIKENFFRGRTLMLERIMFEKFFKDFLIQSKIVKLKLPY